MALKHPENPVKQKDSVIRKVVKIGCQIQIHAMVALVMAGKMIKGEFGAQLDKVEELTGVLIGMCKSQVVVMTMYFLQALEANGGYGEKYSSY